MKAKKLLAALGVLIMAVPGVAFADSFSETVEVVEGNTVFAVVEDLTEINFAAIGGSAAKRTTVGGVLWFNNQELLPGAIASEKAAGYWVIATEAGDDAPADHMDASYLESYRFQDPNGRTWIVDRYTWDECGAYAGGTFHPLPCDAADAADTAQGQDLDSDGFSDTDPTQDLDGDGRADVNRVQLRATKSMFVVQIDATTQDLAGGCGTASGQSYNFVTLIRMDALGGAVSQSVSGDSVANVDLWFSESRPAEPAIRDYLVDDAVGALAPCAPAP